MYLKTIDIFGFKSFADRTRIELKPGITGVIGPNGCGKSNIMESIRWCIGERSWKSLRSDSMISIIFAGTSRRNPMNISEVTLTFDNASRMLPVQYSEVQVTRRIYRSGESEYYINKTQCRQRDIRELFLDTGIGNDGYAILDQGKVSFVLDAKPEDRRAMFEEAAGVSKYKAKREEAIRKLDRLEIDLGRLQDSVSLIDEQVKKLDSDARKAQLFKKYKAELASMEAGAIIRDIGRIDEELAGEGERMAPVKERADALGVSTQTDEARLQALQLERTRHDEEVLGSNQKISDLKADIKILEERIENTIRTAGETNSQLENTKRLIEEEDGRLAEMAPKLEQLETSAEEARAALEKAKAEHDAFHAEFEKLTGERDAAENAVRELGETQIAAQHELTRLGNERQSVDSRLHQNEFQVKQSFRETEKVQQKAAEAREAVSVQESAAARERERVAEAERAVADLDVRHGEVREDLNRRRDERLSVHADIARLKAKIEALEAQGEKDPYFVGAHAVVEAGIPGVRGIVRSLIQVADGHLPLVEDALGDRLYAVVCDDAAAARAGVEFLKTMGEGRARFLVAGALPDSPPVPSSVPPRGRAVLDFVSCEPRFERSIRYLLSDAYELDGGLYGRHWLCGGSREGESLQLELSDIASLEEALKSSVANERDIEERRTALETELHEIEERRGEARTAFGEAKALCGRVEAELEERRSALSLLDEEVVGLTAEVDRLVSESGELKGRLAGLDKDLEEKREQRDRIEREKGEAVERHRVLAEEATRKQATESMLESTVDSRRQQSEFIEDQLGEARLSRETLNRQLETHRDELRAWTAKLEELGASEKEWKESLERGRTELAEKEREALTLGEKQQAMRAESERLDAKLREDKRVLEESRELIHQSELKFSQLETRREDLHQRLTVEWELSYDDAKEKFKDQEVDEDRIAFLRRRIAALGNINMAAPEEYEELTKRRDHLQSQIDDINQAKQDLRSVIQKINATTRENFRQTFSEVRENFRKLYAVLFEGGEADLRLTDEENMLESGVDIVAQPPGKRLQSISQLSGGEKSLTAIALLMAFFMVRPSPMCMLDEADAALDDANVDRFITMIEEFKETTQFVIVSHNKRTMESCDAMYGITMEESGVSQLISIDFKKGGEKPATPAAVEETRGHGPFAPTEAAGEGDPDLDPQGEPTPA
jgi:chromosome segregation protein